MNALCAAAGSTSGSKEGTEPSLGSAGVPVLLLALLALAALELPAATGAFWPVQRAEHTRTPGGVAAFMSAHSKAKLHLTPRSWNVFQGRGNMDGDAGCSSWRAQGAVAGIYLAGLQGLAAGHGSVAIQC